MTPCRYKTYKMSRSFKKYGIIKDKGISRGEYNRVFRRVNRQRVKEGKEPKHLYEVVNCWTVCDYKIRWSRIKQFEIYRKMWITSKEEYLKERRAFFKK